MHYPVGSPLWRPLSPSLPRRRPSVGLYLLYRYPRIGGTQEMAPALFPIFLPSSQPHLPRRRSVRAHMLSSTPAFEIFFPQHAVEIALPCLWCRDTVCCRGSHSTRCSWNHCVVFVWVCGRHASGRFASGGFPSGRFASRALYGSAVCFQFFPGPRTRMTPSCSPWSTSIDLKSSTSVFRSYATVL